MNWIKEHAMLLLIALGGFVAPAGSLIALLQILVIIEYFLSQSVQKKVKDYQNLPISEALMKAFGFILIIFCGLIADDAFKIKAENIQVLVDMGLTKQVKPLTYLLAIWCIAAEAKSIDKVYKKRYKSSLLDQVNFISPLLKKLGVKK